MMKIKKLKVVEDICNEQIKNDDVNDVEKMIEDVSEKEEKDECVL